MTTLPTLSPPPSPLDRLADLVGRCLAGPSRRGGVLAAVSGGADSTALALVLARLRDAGRLPGPLILGHVDHGVHAGSRRAAEHVAALARRLGAGHGERRLPPDPAPRSEADLRAARYAALAAIATAAGARTVVTAHHQDDQLETVLFRVLRGAGPAGLAGIPAARPLGPDLEVVRPLLTVPRRELERVVAAVGLEVADDPTNRELRYARNRLRLEVLPRLRRAHGDRIDAALLGLAGAARNVADLLARHASALLAERALVLAPWRIELGTAGLDPRQRPFLEEAVRRLLAALDPRGREVPWRSVQRAVELLARAAGARVHGPGGPLVERTRAGLLLVDPERAGAPPAHPVPLEPGAGARRFGGTEWRLEARLHRAPPAERGKARDRVWLDPARAPLPWRLRRRAAGDRFRPLGMPGDLDLRDFLRARHVPRFDRDRMPIVVDARGEVVWVPGVEIAHGARTTAATADCMELRLERANPAVDVERLPPG